MTKEEPYIHTSEPAGAPPAAAIVDALEEVVEARREKAQKRKA